MANKLAIAVLGNRNAGKSTTWYQLFDKQVRTSSQTRTLYLTSSHYITDVFLANGSPEERDKPVEDIIGELDPTVVLCSTQYTADNQTLQYFIDHGYDLYVQWLNPGFSDQAPYADERDLVNQLIRAGATVAMRDGTSSPEERVKEIRQFIFGWAAARNLINLDF